MAERIEAADTPSPPPPDTESRQAPEVSKELVDALSRDNPPWPGPDSIRITPDRATHILDGDDNGGGHRAGTGEPGKTEFPADWDDDKILGNIEDVARNPDTEPQDQPLRGTWRYEGTRDGVHTTVIVNPDGTIRTAWPREGDPGVIRNPEEG